MPVRAQDQKLELIGRLAKRVRERIAPDRAEEVERFVRQLYANVPPGDLLRNTVEDLYGAALGLWNFSQQRRLGEPKIRAFNPTPSEHGCRSTVMVGLVGHGGRANPSALRLARPQPDSRGPMPTPTIVRMSVERRRSDH